MLSLSIISQRGATNIVITKQALHRWERTQVSLVGKMLSPTPVQPQGEVFLWREDKRVSTTFHNHFFHRALAS